jgi:hypothetical protein
VRAAAQTAAQPPAASPEHSPTEKCDMTWEEVFRFAFTRSLIPTLKALGGVIGEEKLVAMLQEAVNENARKRMAANKIPTRDMATWSAGLRNAPPIFQHALVYEIVEDTPQAFEMRVKQCLWAKTFRASDAAAIGYACICHPDFGVAAGFHPKFKLIRTKTLMQGHDCCNHRWIQEA